MKRISIYILAFALSIILASPATAADYVTSGQEYFNKGQYDLAIIDFSKAIELNPRDAGIYGWRGAAYNRKGQYDLAIIDLNTAIELNPNDANAYAWRGNSYTRKGQYDLAIADLNKAIDLNPKDDFAYAERGFAYIGKGQYDLAIIDLNTAIELNPRDAIVYGNRGFAYLRRGQYDLAITDYNTTIELKPKEAAPYYHLAYVHHKKGNKEMAKGTLLKAIAADPAIIDKRAAYLDRPTASKKFYAEELIALSEYVTVPSAILAKAKGLSGEITASIDIHDMPDFKAVSRPNDLAVIIGIENYRGLPKSDYSKSDAGLVKDYLKALGFRERNIEFITDADATKSSIEKSIEAWLPNRIKKDSRVFVYYSGHGAPEPKTGDAYIVPYDGDPNYLEVTGYSLKRLYDKLGKLQVAEVTVVLDSCFSGAGGRSVLAKGARPLVMTADIGALASNIAVLSATQGTQISTSSPEKGHGIFTYYFLKALKDGKKTIADIYEYIKPLVEDEAKQINVQQSPSISPEVEKLRGKFILRR